MEPLNPNALVLQPLKEPEQEPVTYALNPKALTTKPLLSTSQIPKYILKPRTLNP